jgi:hypothetical protein
MAYIVEGMKLIPQELNMSCWYASAQMLIKWKEEKEQKSFAHLISPEFDTQCSQLRDNNKGIQNPQIIQMAERIGLKHVPPVTPTPEWIELWLKTYGPLWVNGKTHIVVIAGIAWFPGLGYMLLVYDPAPVSVGRVEWRSIGWYTSGNSASTRDTGKDVETVFLYVPDDI